MSKLINLTSETLIQQSKQDLDNYVLDIINKIPEKLELDYYMLAYKFEYIAKQLKDSCLKTRAKDRFIGQFHGSKTETANGFKMSLVETKEYEYSNKVKDIEKRIKNLQADLKAAKDKEKTNEIAKEVGSNTILKMTLL